MNFENIDYSVTNAAAGLSAVAPVYVVDASIGVKWFLGEDDSDLAARLLTEADEGCRRLIAPSLFWYEVANALRWSPEVDANLFNDLEALAVCPIERVDPPPGSLPFLGVLARKTELTMYDAIYMLLAIRCGVPLLTADRKLAEACAGIVPVLTLKQLFGGLLMEAAQPYIQSRRQHALKNGDDL